MSNNANEHEELDNLDAEIIESLDDLDPDDDQTDWQKEAKKYHAIAKRRAAQLKERDTQLDELKKRPQEKTAETPSNREEKQQGLSEEVIELRLDGYSKDEVEFIMRNGGRKALDDDMVKAALQVKREQRKAEEEASKIPDTSGMTDVERKYTPEQLENMSVEELEKILPKA